MILHPNNPQGLRVGALVGRRVGGRVGCLVALIGTGAGATGLIGGWMGAVPTGFKVGARVSMGFTGAAVGFAVGARELENGRAQEHPSLGPRHNVSTHICVLLSQRQTHRPPLSLQPLLTVAFVISVQSSGGSPTIGSV